MENLFVIHSAFIYLFICFYYYIRHYTNQNKTKGGKKRTLSLWTCLMLPLTGFACFWREHIQINHKEKIWKVKMLCKFSKLEIWYQLPVCCSTFGCAGGCELLPHIVLIMWTLSPVAPGWSITRSICRQALKRFIIYYQQGWHMRYHNGSVCFTHYLMSLPSLSCAIKSFNVKK